MEIIKVEGYSYKELSNEAKEKAIEWGHEVVCEDDWYMQDDIFDEIAKDYGIKIRMSEACFDLDRGNYLAFETYNHGQKKDYIKGIYIENEKKFCKKAGVKRNEEYSINIAHNHFAGGRISNYIEADDYTEEEAQELHSVLMDCLGEIKTQLHINYESMTSRESVEDFLEANEYLFTAEGKRTFIL